MASSVRSCPLTNQAACSFPVASSVANTEPVPCLIRECVASPQEQAPVGPDRIDGSSTSARDLLGEALPALHGSWGNGSLE